MPTLSGEQKVVLAQPRSFSDDAGVTWRLRLGRQQVRRIDALLFKHLGEPLHDFRQYDS